jgi:hypothetical protein
MRVALWIVAIVLGVAASSCGAAADPLIVTKSHVSAKLYRGPFKAVVCLSAYDPVHLSGEYGVHVSWAPQPGKQPKEVELYSKTEYFSVPVRVEVPLPREARSVRVEVGACVANDYCDSIELNLELRKAAIESTVDSIDCRP